MHGLRRHTWVLLGAIELGCGARSSLENTPRRQPDVLDGSKAPGEPERPGDPLKPDPVSPNPPTTVTQPTSPPPVTPTVPQPVPSPSPTDVPQPVPSPTDVPTPVPNPSYDGWASCKNPLKLEFAAGSGGTYTSFSNDAVDTVVSGCDEGKDVVFSWTAPHEGYFAFSTPNTDYPVTIGLLAPNANCSPALACNQTPVAGGPAYLEQYARLGETFFIVLESNKTGRFSLAIEPIELPRPCNPMHLGSGLEVDAIGDLIRDAQANAFGSYCRSGRRSVPFTYTAPCTGSYLVTAPAAFDTVLIAAKDCRASDHECNDDFPSPNGSSARLNLQLSAGEELLLFLAADRDIEDEIGQANAWYFLQIENLTCSP